MTNSTPIPAEPAVPADASAADAASSTYSKPVGGLFCLLGTDGSILVNPEGQACCFDSEAAAAEFLDANPKLKPQLTVQEVFVKGQVHGWESVPSEDVEERSLKHMQADSL